MAGSSQDCLFWFSNINVWEMHRANWHSICTHWQALEFCFLPARKDLPIYRGRYAALKRVWPCKYSLCTPPPWPQLWRVIVYLVTNYVNYFTSLHILNSYFIINGIILEEILSVCKALFQLATNQRRRGPPDLGGPKRNSFLTNRFDSCFSTGWYVGSVLTSPTQIYTRGPLAPLIPRPWRLCHQF